MKNNVRQLLAGVLGAVGALFGNFDVDEVEAQTANDWTNSVSSKWETPGNWSLGIAPTNTHSAILITNATTKTVTIDATTTGTPTMTISNLIVSGPVGTVNTLQLTNAGAATPLRILNEATINGGGVWLITNSAVSLDRATAGGTFTVNGQLSLLDSIVTNRLALDLGTASGSTGAVWMTGGTLFGTNARTSIGRSSGVGQMTVSNGNVASLDVVVGSQAGSQGTLTLAGGTNQLEDGLTIASTADTTGTVWVTGGQLVVTNGSSIVVGGSGVGQMTVSNGAVLAGSVSVAVSSRGTLTIAGGTNTFGSIMFIGTGVGSTGAVWLTGGQLVHTNTALNIGANGVGQMTVSNGTALHGLVTVGVFKVGTLTVNGGTDAMAGPLNVGNIAGSTGTVWVTGGQLVVTNNPALVGAGSGFAVDGGVILANGSSIIVSNVPAVIGNTGSGSFTNFGGSLAVSNLTVGNLAGARGTLILNGGTTTVPGVMVVGNSSCLSSGIVTIAGGRLFVTNTGGSAVLEVRSGTLRLNSGTLTIDTLVMTNACGNFVHTGGTLVYGTAVLDPNRDDDGDGIPNGYEQAHGLDPLNPADAALDSDGDGASNLQEFLAGTDPTNNASAFRITSIARQANTNILVTWTMGAGKTNALQRTTGDASGSYRTNGFTDIFTVTNTVGTTTNRVDSGAATNVPSLYYRVRLVP